MKRSISFRKLSPFGLTCLLSALLTSHVYAVVLPFTNATLSPSPAGNVQSTTFLTSYTTSAGTVSDLGTAVSGNGIFDIPNSASTGDVRNSWGVNGSEIDGVESALNLDISTGVLNAGDTSDATQVDVENTGGTTANFFFGGEISSGLAGNGNDFFIVENGGNDEVNIVPIDASGNQIGDFSLSITTSDWGTEFTTALYDRTVEASSSSAQTAFGGLAFDFEDFSGTGSLVGMRGIGISGDDGIDALVVGLNSVLAPTASPVLTANRTTGQITLTNTSTGVPLDIRGYSITSELGALDQTGWKTIAGNYDNAAGGDGSVDDDGEWTVLTDPGVLTDLSEFEFFGDGGTIAPNSSVLLSQAAGAWIPSPIETDLVAELSLADGSVISIPVLYQGNNGQALLQSDLNHDGTLDEADWVVFRTNNPADFSLLSSAEAYAKGDLNRDGKSDLEDFILFREDYIAANGSGSFSVLLQSVPEPSTLLLTLGMVGLALVSSSRRKFAGYRHLLLGLTTATLLLASTPGAEADIIATEDFESYTPGIILTGGTVGSTTPETPFGGVGWVGSWDSTNDPDNNATGNANIAMRNVTTAANGIDGQSFILQGGTNAKNIATRAIAQQNDTIYIGMDLKANDNWDNSFFQFYVNDTLANSPTDGLSFGLGRDDTPGPGDWFVRTSTGSAITTTGSVFDPTSTHRVVMKLSKSTGLVQDNYDEVSLWVDTFNEATPNVQHTEAWDDNAIDTLHFRVNNIAVDDIFDDFIMFDNLSVATTLQEAATVPLGDVFTFKAQVNSVTGEISLFNETSSPIEISSYEITSPSNRLLTNWTGMGSRDAVDGPDVGLTLGDGEGETWENAGNVDSSVLIEHFLLGSTTLAGNEEISLGTAYMTGLEDTEMTFRYFDVAQGAIRTGEIEFVTSAAVDADFDSDGDVDGSDFLAWQRGFGTGSTQAEGDANGDGNVNAADLAVWQTQYGNGSSGGSLAGVAVPEPSALALLVLAALATAVASRDQH